MMGADADRGEREAARDGHRLHAACVVKALLGAGVAPSAELAPTVVPPAVRRSAGGETAGMKHAGAQRCEAEPALDRHRDVADVPAVIDLGAAGSPVAELAIGVV